MRLHFGKTSGRYQFRDSIWCYPQNSKTDWKSCHYFQNSRFLEFYRLLECRLGFSIVLGQTFLKFVGVDRGIWGQPLNWWNWSQTFHELLPAIWCHIDELGRLSRRGLGFQWCSSCYLLIYASRNHRYSFQDSRIFRDFCNFSKWSQAKKQPFTDRPNW